MDAWLVAFIGVQMAFFAFLLWLIANYRLRNRARQSEERLRLLERFESGKDFEAFLDSESGGSFLESFRSPGLNLRALWTVSLYGGLVALFCGFGFFFLSRVESFREPQEFLVPAFLLIAGGSAALLAGFLTRPSDRS